MSLHFNGGKCLKNKYRICRFLIRAKKKIIKQVRTERMKKKDAVFDSGIRKGFVKVALSRDLNQEIELAMAYM